MEYTDDGVNHGYFEVPIARLQDGIVTDDARVALAEAIERVIPALDIWEANAHPSTSEVFFGDGPSPYPPMFR